MKRLAAIFLCLTLLLLSFPISASAVGSSYDINVSAGVGGRNALMEDGPSENGDVSIEEGNDMTMYIIPDNHYSIDEAVVVGVSQGAITQYTLIASTLYITESTDKFHISNLFERSG